MLREFRALVGVLIALAADAAEEVDAARAFFDDMPFPVRVPWPTTVRQCWGCWPMCASADSMSWGPRQGLSRLSVEEGRLHGRATRLFVSPVLQSLEQLTGASSFLPYLQAFRYPLAGEFASTRGLAMNLRVPCDWGLEIGLLSEVYRHVAICRIAQVGLGTFDHKHKAIGAGPDEGLQRMCCEGLASLLQGLMEHESRALTGEQLSALEVVYRRVAEGRVRQHVFDARLNSIPYDRHLRGERGEGLHCPASAGVHLLHGAPFRLAYAQLVESSGL